MALLLATSLVPASVLAGTNEAWAETKDTIDPNPPRLLSVSVDRHEAGVGDVVTVCHEAEDGDGLVGVNPVVLEPRGGVVTWMGGAVDCHERGFLSTDDPGLYRVVGVRVEDRAGYVTTFWDEAYARESGAQGPTLDMSQCYYTFIGSFDGDANPVPVKPDSGASANTSNSNAEIPSASAAEARSQKIVVSGSIASINASKLSKSKLKTKQTFTVKAKGAATKIIFKKVSGDKALSISKNGKVTIAKGTKMGTRSMIVKASAPMGIVKGKKYASASKSFTVRVAVGAQTVKLAKTSGTLRVSKLKKAKQILTVKVAVTAKKLASVKNVSTGKAAKKFKIMRSGTKIKIIVPKGTKGGAYTVKVKVTAPKVAGKCLATTKVLAYKVKVK